MTYRGYIMCQRCGEIVGWGFTGYCHDLEIYCLDCGSEKELEK